MARKITIEFLGKDTSVGRTAKDASTSLDKVGRSATDMGETTRKGTVKAAAGLDDMKKGAAEVGDSLSQVSADAKESFSKVGILAGGVLGVGLAAGVGDALSSLDAAAKLKAQLGLTEKQSQAAGKIAGSLYANAYGDSLETVNDAVRHVVQDTGTRLNSVNLEGITGKVLSLSDTFDQDLGGTTRAVGQLMRTGLAKNAKEALDIVAAGFQNGADKSDDFLDTLNEYGTQFRKLGLTGQQATGLISQGLKAGARDGDVVADALKEFAIRAVDGSDASQVAYEKLGLSASKMTAQIAKGGKPAAAGLQTVLDKLRAIHDPVKREAAAVGLFGTQAEDLGKSLFALDPSKAVASLGKVEGAAKRVDKTVGATASATLTHFKRSIQTNVTNGLAAAIKGFQTGKTEGDGFLGIMSRIGSVAHSVGNFIKDNGEAVKALVIALGAAVLVTKAVNIATSVYETYTKLATAAQWLWNAAMDANPIGLVVIAIAALAAGLVIAYKKSETFRKIVNGALNAVKKVALAVFGAVKKAAMAVWSWLKSAWGSLKITIIAPFQFARDFIGNVWGKLKAGASSFKGFVTDKFNGIVDFFKRMPSRISHAVSGMFDGIKEAFRAAINWIIEKWNNLAFSIPGVNTHIPGVGTVGGFTLGTPNIPYLAKGGIVTRPTLAMLGERGPEAVLPLSRGGGMGATNVYINVNGALDPSAVARQIEEMLIRRGRTTGRPLQFKTISS